MPGHIAQPVELKPNVISAHVLEAELPVALVTQVQALDIRVPAVAKLKTDCDLRVLFGPACQVPLDELSAQRAASQFARPCIWLLAHTTALHINRDVSS